MPKRPVGSVGSAWRRVEDGGGRCCTAKGRRRWSEPITTVQRAAGVFFPLDQRLQLGEQSWTPQTIEKAVRMGIEIASYERAAVQFSELSHVNLSKSALHRLVNDLGGRLTAVQAAEAVAMVQVPKQEVEVIWREVPEPDSDCMNISMDGVLVRLRREGWKEVKVATFSAVTHDIAAESGEWSMHLRQHSYRAGLWEVDEFAAHQWAEATRRGVEKATYLSSVNDGAAWIWNLTRRCYGRCVEILDWWHAIERLWTLAHQHFGADSPQAAAWVAAQKELLLHSRLRTVLHNVRLLYPRLQPLPDPVRKAVVYLYHNRWRMRYQQFRQAGYPIGSGTVESACKLVAQARLKQSGMSWSRPGAQAVLSLRTCLLSQRWHDPLALLHPT
jgi:hypothetical protein